MIQLYPRPPNAPNCRVRDVHNVGNMQSGWHGGGRLAKTDGTDKTVR